MRASSNDDYCHFQQFGRNELPSDNEEEVSTHIHHHRQFYNENSENFERKDVEDRRLRRLMQHKDQGDVEER